jgi:hypothetical protein
VFTATTRRGTPFWVPSGWDSTVGGWGGTLWVTVATFDKQMEPIHGIIIHETFLGSALQWHPCYLSCGIRYHLLDDLLKISPFSKMIVVLGDTEVVGGTPFLDIFLVLERGDFSKYFSI